MKNNDKIKLIKSGIYISCIGLKEYQADWLENVKTVTRDASGRFASKLKEVEANTVEGLVENLDSAIGSLKEIKDSFFKTPVKSNNGNQSSPIKPEDVVRLRNQQKILNNFLDKEEDYNFLFVEQVKERIDIIDWVIEKREEKEQKNFSEKPNKVKDALGLNFLSGLEKRLEDTIGTLENIKSSLQKNPQYIEKISEVTKLSKDEVLNILSKPRKVVIDKKENLDFYFDKKSEINNTEERIQFLSACFVETGKIINQAVEAKTENVAVNPNQTSKVEFKDNTLSALIEDQEKVLKELNNERKNLIEQKKSFVDSESKILSTLGLEFEPAKRLQEIMKLSKDSDKDNSGNIEWRMRILKANLKYSDDVKAIAESSSGFERLIAKIPSSYLKDQDLSEDNDDLAEKEIELSEMPSNEELSSIYERIDTENNLDFMTGKEVKFKKIGDSILSKNKDLSDYLAENKKQNEKANLKNSQSVKDSQQIRNRSLDLLASKRLAQRAAKLDPEHLLYVLGTVDPEISGEKEE